MSGVSETESSLWFEWDDATLKRKANATQSDNAQDYADRHAAIAIRKGRKEWTKEEVMKKANASRYDYENYEDRHVAKAINKRDRNDASREAHDKAETAMASLSIDGPPKLPRDRGTAFKDAIYYDDSKSGKEPQKRKPKVPLVPSGSGGKSRTDNAGVQVREGRGSEREKGKRNRSVSASRTGDSLKKPPTASPSNPNNPSTTSSSKPTKPPTTKSSKPPKPPTTSAPIPKPINPTPVVAGSSNTTSGSGSTSKNDSSKKSNAAGSLICPALHCRFMRFSREEDLQQHYETVHWQKR